MIDFLIMLGAVFVILVARNKLYDMQYGKKTMDAMRKEGWI